MATNLLNLGGKPARPAGKTGGGGGKGVPATELTSRSAAGGGKGFGSLNAATKASLIFAVPAVMLVALALPALLGASVEAPEEMTPGAAMQVAVGDEQFTPAEPFDASVNGMAPGLPGGMAPGAPAPTGGTAAAAPAQTPAPAPTARPSGNTGSSRASATRNSSGQRVHVLEAGQTLGEVAKIYFRTSAKWRDIARANGIPESDARRVREGTELIIPDLDGQVGNPGNTGSERTTPVSGGPFIALDTSSTNTSLTAAGSVAPARPVREVVCEAQTHLLQPGDSPYRLAMHYYDDLYEHRRIRQANPDVDWMHIVPGQEIRIPELVRGTMTTASASTGSINTPSASSGERTYTVKRGDTLSGISREVYGTASNWQAIMRANNMRNPTDLREGQVLRIPAR